MLKSWIGGLAFFCYSLRSSSLPFSVINFKDWRKCDSAVDFYKDNWLGVILDKRKKDERRSYKFLNSEREQS